VSVDAETVCAEVAEVVCWNLRTCCTEGEIEDYLGIDDPPTPDQCRADVAILCEREIATREWSAENGRSQLDPGVLETCLNALLAPDGACVTIATVAPWAAACAASAWTGLVQAGGACVQDFECAGDRSTFAPDQTCAPAATAGESCVGALCVPGHYCDGDICRPLVGPGDSCLSDVQCDAGLYCDTRVDECATRAQIGQPCTWYSGCVEGATCTIGRCDDGFDCFADEDCSGACDDDGSACVDATDCGTGTCSVSGATCFDDSDCSMIGVEVCEFPAQCLPTTCKGSRRCIELHDSYDYCDAASALPF
jgi:hypothetical protein